MKTRYLTLKQLATPGKKTYVIWFRRKSNNQKGRYHLRESKGYLVLLYRALKLSARFKTKEYHISYYEWDDTGTMVRAAYISRFLAGARTYHYPLR